MQSRSLISRTVRRLLTTLAPVLVLAACEDHPLPTALSPSRPARDVLPDPCVVTSTGDAGDGSLRAAIAEPTCSTITFNLPLPATITLTSDQLLIDRTVSINGPGADKLTVARSSADGTPSFRIFSVDGGTDSISGVTITNGRAGIFGGGGIVVGNADLTLDRCAVIGNTAFIDGGGGISDAVGSVTIAHSLVANNSAAGGGGIFQASRGASVSLIHTTVSGNHATQGSGGGILVSNFMRISEHDRRQRRRDAWRLRGRDRRRGTSIPIWSSVVAKTAPTTDQTCKA